MISSIYPFEVVLTKSWRWSNLTFFKFKNTINDSKHSWMSRNLYQIHNQVKNHFSHLPKLSELKSNLINLEFWLLSNFWTFKTESLVQYSFYQLENCATHPRKLQMTYKSYKKSQNRENQLKVRNDHEDPYTTPSLFVMFPRIDIQHLMTGFYPENIFLK